MQSSKILKIILIVSSALAAALPHLAMSAPSAALAPWLLWAGSVFAVVTGVCGSISDSFFPNMAKKASDAAAKSASVVTKLFMFVFVVAWFALVPAFVHSAAPLASDETEGCTPQQEAKVAADLSPIGACVLQSALAGTPPLVVLAQCAPVTIQGAIDIVSTFMSAKPTSDGAVLMTPAQDAVLRAWLADAKALAAQREAGK